jgi:hypothetical protein
MSDLLPYLIIVLYPTLTIGLWVTSPREWNCLHCGALDFSSLCLCNLPPKYVMRFMLLFLSILMGQVLHHNPLTPTINYLAKITNLTNYLVCPKDLWAQYGSWCSKTPIYMFNWITRLEAVVEIITNHTASALELLARQQTQMHAAIYIYTYQNHLALDYLLAEEEGACGKFNHLDWDCCLHINDKGQVVTNIATNIRKIIHIPIQTWDGWKFNNWFRGWFSWLFLLLGPNVVIWAVLCFSPYLLNFLMHFISSHLDSIKLQMLLHTHF